jgi:hypothetical protein
MKSRNVPQDFSQKSRNSLRWCVLATLSVAILCVLPSALPAQTKKPPH